jgi:hypothetical protein
MPQHFGGIPAALTNSYLSRQLADNVSEAALIMEKQKTLL